MSEPAFISIRGVSHAFGSGALAKTVLHEVDVDFHAGEISIIVGPSGSGKTTLLSLVGALRSVQSGSVKIGGIELRGATKAQQLAVRASVGYIFQAHNLIDSLTARENVQLGLAVQRDATASSSRQQALDLLARVGLAEHAGKFPRQLSGGQKQRVAIARALVRSPQVVLADEPTAALDRHSGREVVTLLQHLAQQMRCTVLLVTHDSRILDIADRILTLEDGLIQETNLALDRLVTLTVELLPLLARYPSHFHDLSALTGPLQERFAVLLPRLSELVGRRQRGDTRAPRWLQIAETLRRLEAALVELAELLPRAPALRSVVLPSLEFLLETAAKTFENPHRSDAQLLGRLTGPRSHEALWQHDRDSAASPEILEVYFRVVHFLHELAFALDEDLA